MSRSNSSGTNCRIQVSAASAAAHPVSECVPLDKGIMVEEFEGPYSWNRYSQLLNPGLGCASGRKVS